AGLRGGGLLLPRETINPLAFSTGSVRLKKLLSLVTFFAAAKKVTPPPGRRLLNQNAPKTPACKQPYTDPTPTISEPKTKYAKLKKHP
ncbi:hypothetical protein, partial [Caballeronia sp. BR00000012568055]|uniref:hypothetical protein n=1 Tax=Caballeronia sp. BR00000012568055 TaxID=2918761 RepID=UPI0023F9160D